MLSKRLFHIASFITENDFAADIGADHGKLVLFLANKYKNSTFLAVENKKGPFNALTNAVNEHSIYKNIECSFSDGIEYLPEFVNTLIFAGMGGMNVVNIIERSYRNLKNINKIVVSVHNKINELLDFLLKNGYKIEDFDAIKEDGIIYLIFSFKLKQEKELINYSDSIKSIKSVLIKNNLYNEYREKIQRNVENEKKSKKSLDFYEYSDAFNLNYLLLNGEDYEN